MVCSVRVLSIRAGEEFLEDRLQARQARGRDGDVQLDGCPDCDVARVPEEISFFPVVWQVGDFDGCRGAGEDADSQDAEQGHPCAEVDLQFPEHGQWDRDGEE